MGKIRSYAVVMAELQVARHELNQLIFNKVDKVHVYTADEWRKVSDEHRSRIKRLEYEAQNLWVEENP